MPADQKSMEFDGDRTAAAAQRSSKGWRRVVVAKPERVTLLLLAALALALLVSGGGWQLLKSSTYPPNMIQSVNHDEEVLSTRREEPVPDKLLGGLLSQEHDVETCIGRYEVSRYRPSSPFRPSDYLVERLRKYEAYHRKCGPGTPHYEEAIRQLKSGRNAAHSVCRYVIWLPLNGLGNRIITIAATFLYALLTDRILLTNMWRDMTGLFCEPFPGATWEMPPDFPYPDPFYFTVDSPESYLVMLKNGVVSNDDPDAVLPESLPAFVYWQIEQLAMILPDHMFCDEDQLLMNKFNWMVLRADSYFVPALFLLPAFRDELLRMFPQKDTVFHHLGRYLFHPANSHWGDIARYYDAYLSRADERVGMQIRNVSFIKTVTFDEMYDDVVKCSLEEGLLPRIVAGHSPPPTTNSTGKLRAVLVASLHEVYYDRMREVYFSNPTATGESVAIYQPSHEERQTLGSLHQNQKALVDMFLLSFCDKLLTSAWSTFGYVAHGLAGLRPWFLMRPAWFHNAPEACIRTSSLEPCLHSPPFLGCKSKNTIHAPDVVPYVRQCEDAPSGIKVYPH